MSNNHLNRAKKNINDEYYTRYEDVKKQLDVIDLSNYKKILLPCDTQESAFYKYLNDNKDKLYKNVEITLEEEEFRNRKFEDYDLILTNPPFSELKEFMEKVVNSNKDYILILPLVGFSKLQGYFGIVGKVFALNNINKFLIPDGSLKTAQANFWTNIRECKKIQRKLGAFKFIRADNGILNFNSMKDFLFYEAEKGKIKEQFYLPITLFLYDYSMFNVKVIEDRIKVNGKTQFIRLLVEYKEDINA